MNKSETLSARMASGRRSAESFLQKHLDDLLIVSGCGLTVAAAATISTAAGLGLAGVELIILGVLFGVGGKRK